MSVMLDPQLKERILDEVRYFIESHEAELSRYGLFDVSTTLRDMVRLFHFSSDLHRELGTPNTEQSKQALADALQELVRRGDLIRLDDGPVEVWHVRSRMAEIARLILLSRQRFRTHWVFTRSKSLVQDVHFEVRPRRYPRRDQPFDDLWAKMLRGGQAEQATAAELSQVWTLLQVALDPQGKQNLEFSKFQMQAFTHLGGWLIDGLSGECARGLVVGAGTGAGKTHTFFIPSLAYAILEKMVRGRLGVKAVAVYPRIKLAQNQLETFLGTLRHLNEARGERPAVTMAIEYGDILYRRSDLASAKVLAKRNWLVVGQEAIFPAAKCPACQGPLVAPIGHHPKTPPLRCQKCQRLEEHLLYVREDWCVAPPDFYVAVTESLNKRLLDGKYGGLFGDGRLPDGTEPSIPGVLMLDEIHLHVANKGMQIGYLVRRLQARLRRAAERRGQSPRLALVGLSATIAEARSFFHKLTGLEQHQIEVVLPQEAELERRGSEYFLFVKANPEERASAMSTLLQSAMVLAHNMPQPNGRRFLSLGFADSHDLVGRWAHQLNDAENGYDPVSRGRKRLFDLRNVAKTISDPHFQKMKHYFRTPPADCGQCTERPNRHCVMFKEGECWWPMSFLPNAQSEPLGLAVETSRRTATQEELRTKDLVVATSRLEVGYDDDRIMAVLQYQAPGDAASFIQRKGRAGRQYGTYPITMMVLNPYRPQDAFYFKNPHLLTAPVFKELPLNPDNRLVQRVHGFYAMFEHFQSRDLAANGGSRATLDFGSLQQQDADRLRAWTSTDEDLQAVMQAIQDALCLGRDQAVSVLASEDGVLREGLKHLVERIDGSSGQYVSGSNLLKDYLPQNFFSDINLPQLRVMRGSNFYGDKDEPVEVMDLAPGLRTVMPGKVSWRGETPYWVPPLLTPGTRHRWYDLDENWEVREEKSRLNGQAVPVRLRRRLDLEAHRAFRVFRPGDVKVQPFSSKFKEGWFLAPPEGNGGLRSPRQAGPDAKLRDRLDERSVSYGLTFDRVEFSDTNLPPGMSFESSDAVSATAFGPYAHRLLRRVRLADCRFTPMSVLRLTAGGEMTLKWPGGSGYSEAFGFRRDEEPCLMGYELRTEGMSFDLQPTLWPQLPNQTQLVGLRLRAFAFLAKQELQAIGCNPFTLDRLLAALMSHFTQLPASDQEPREVAGDIEGGAWREAVRFSLQHVYRAKPDDENEAMAMYNREEVRSELGKAWRSVHGANESAFRDWVWDMRVLSLGQAMLLAAQNLAGVEVGQQLSIRVPLRLDEGRGTAPTIHLFEEGIGGLGVARSLHEQFRSHPMAFWDAVEAQLGHCPVGDEEDLILALLSLPEDDIRAISALAIAVLRADSLEDRGQRLLGLQHHFRHQLGLDPTPAMIKAILRVFTPPFEEGGLEILNWQLFREINVVAGGQFRDERGVVANDHELVTHILEQLRRVPDSLPALGQLQYLLSLAETEDWEVQRERIEKALKTASVKSVFNAISSLDEIERLIAMGDETRRAVFVSQFGLKMPQGFDPRDFEPDWVGETEAEREETFLRMFDEIHFKPEGAPMWAQTVWRICHGQGDQVGESYLEDSVRAAMQREVLKRYLSSCRTACPNCLENTSVAFTDRPLLDRRLTHQALISLRESSDIRLNDQHTVEALLHETLVRFQQGQPRCYFVFELRHQVIVSQAIARLADEGVRLEIGRHTVAVATTNLRTLGLPTHRPLYEVGIELGDPR